MSMNKQTQYKKHNITRKKYISYCVDTDGYVAHKLMVETSFKYVYYSDNDILNTVI